MSKNHIKTLNTPISWDAKVKETKYVAKPSPGGQSNELAMPLSLFLRSQGLVKTRREVKYLLENDAILVDGKPVNDERLPVGLMDIVQMKGEGIFRVLIDRKKKLFGAEITKKESKIKPCKIVGKTLIKGGNIQLNLSDGRNIIVKKDKYNTNDSVIYDVSKNKIKEHIKLEKGVSILLTAGKHAGDTGNIKDLLDRNIIYESGKERYQTDKDHVFVVGKKKPAIKIKNESDEEDKS